MITLGTVAAQPFSRQVGVLVVIALLMTVGVYGLVAGIVKLDDAGLRLSRGKSAGLRAVGHGILRSAPWLMRFLSVAGTAAMFLVGGGILAHGVPAVHHTVTAIVPAGGWGILVSLLADAAVGVAAGVLVVLAVTALGRAAPPGQHAGRALVIVVLAGCQLLTLAGCGRFRGIVDRPLLAEGCRSQPLIEHAAKCHKSARCNTSLVTKR